MRCRGAVSTRVEGPIIGAVPQWERSAIWMEVSRLAYPRAIPLFHNHMCIVSSRTRADISVNENAAGSITDRRSRAGQNKRFSGVPSIVPRLVEAIPTEIGLSIAVIYTGIRYVWDTHHHTQRNNAGFPAQTRQLSKRPTLPNYHGGRSFAARSAWTVLNTLRKSGLPKKESGFTGPGIRLCRFCPHS